MRRRYDVACRVGVRFAIPLSSAQNIRISYKLSGNIEENPGPKPTSCDCWSNCHLKLNSISAHKFIKLSLLCAYISVKKTDIICLSETYLDSSIPSDDDNLALPGYNVVSADKPTNTKRGSVCIYYHNSLSLKVIDIQFLNECIIFEIRIGRKFCSFLCLYRSSSQTRDIFEKSADNFELTLDLMIKHMRQIKQDTLESKIRITCENYSQIKTSYKYKETRKNMNRNKSIFLRQDKRRGAVNLDYSNYIKNT